MLICYTFIFPAVASRTGYKTAPVGYINITINMADMIPLDGADAVLFQIAREQKALTCLKFGTGKDNTCMKMLPY